MNKRPFTVWAAQVLLSVCFLAVLISTFVCLGFIETLKGLAGFPTGASAGVFTGASVFVYFFSVLIELLILLALWGLQKKQAYAIELSIALLTLEFAVAIHLQVTSLNGMISRQEISFLLGAIALDTLLFFVIFRLGFNRKVKSFFRQITALSR